MDKRVRYVICFLVFILSNGLSQACFGADSDFRDVVWGMSRLEVMAKEDMSPVSLEAPFIYYRSRIGGEIHHLIYRFIEDKLVSAVYIIVTRPQNAYLKFKKDVERKYGPPAKSFDRGSRNYLFFWNEKRTEIAIKPGNLRECRIEYSAKQYKDLVKQKREEWRQMALNELIWSY